MPSSIEDEGFRQPENWGEGILDKENSVSQDIEARTTRERLEFRHIKKGELRSYLFKN